jgi:chloramphenicol 3-O-phosphotransferase
MSVILLTGPIGSGKTTVARELIALLSPPVFHIEGDMFWSFFTKADMHVRRQQFRLMMRSMIAAAVPLAKEGYQVIVDFSIPPDFVDTARKIVKDIPLHFVLLRPSFSVCAQRAHTRQDGRITDYDRGFYELFEATKLNAICDDQAEPRELAARIRDGLDRADFRLQ